MPQIIQSPEFRQDTDEAWDYFTEENPDYADRFIRQIADKLTLLARFPHMGRPRDDIQPGLRSLRIILMASLAVQTDCYPNCRHPSAYTDAGNAR